MSEGTRITEYVTKDDLRRIAQKIDKLRLDRDVTNEPQTRKALNDVVRAIEDVLR